MKPLTPNRAICDGDTGSTQRPSKDKTVIWRTCREMSGEQLDLTSRTHQSMAWRSVAEQIIRERCADTQEPKKPILLDSAPFTKETTKITRSRKAKKHKSPWTRKWSSV